MRVNVNEPGRDDEPSGVDCLCRLRSCNAADRRDPSVLDRHVLHDTRTAGPVDDGAAGDEQVIAWGLGLTILHRHARDATDQERGACEQADRVHRAGCGLVARLTIEPTTSTTTTPIGLCHK